MLFSEPALANGRFPQAQMLAPDPSDASHLVLRTTFGLLVTRDAGKTWRYVCEKAPGFRDVEDPPIAMAQGGTTLLAEFAGLTVSTTLCDWTFAPIGSNGAVDVSVEKSDPSHVVAFVSRGRGDYTYINQLWQSPDSGQTFTQVGTDLDNDFIALTVDVAKSDVNRVYVTAITRPLPPPDGGTSDAATTDASSDADASAPTRPGLFLRSYNGGQSWERLEIQGANELHQPFLGAVDPNQPDVLYVRLWGKSDSTSDLPDKLLVSKDAGTSFTEVLSVEGDMLGLALSPDGSTIVAGSSTQGLFRATTDTLAPFENVSAMPIQGLTWTDAGLYASSTYFSDAGVVDNRFLLGLSTNGGDSWTPLWRRLSDVAGILDCATGSQVATICPAQWYGAGKVCETLSSPDCTGSGTGGSGGAKATPNQSQGDSGCSFKAAEPAATLAAPFGALALLALSRLRRRRR